MNRQCRKICVYCRENGDSKILSHEWLHNIKTDEELGMVRAMIEWDMKGQVYCPIIDGFILQQPPKECPYQTEHVLSMSKDLI